MLNTPFTPQTADDAKRLLDADLYGNAQQGLEHENLAATGNLNVGFVIDYDTESARRLEGASLYGQQNYAGSNEAFGIAPSSSAFDDKRGAYEPELSSSSLPDASNALLDADSSTSDVTAAPSSTSTITESATTSFQSSQSTLSQTQQNGLSQTTTNTTNSNT